MLALQISYSWPTHVSRLTSSESLTHVKRNLGNLSLLVQSLKNTNRKASDVVVAAPLRINAIAKQNRVLPQICFFDVNTV